MALLILSEPAPVFCKEARFFKIFILIVDYVLRRRLMENNSSSCLLITPEILRVGLQVNGTKTKVLHFGLDDAQALHLPAREVITAFADFSYFGSHLMFPDTIIAKQRVQAWRVAFLLSGFFSNAGDTHSWVRSGRIAPGATPVCHRRKVSSAISSSWQDQVCQ